MFNLQEPFDRRQWSDPSSETYLLDQAIRQTRRKERKRYAKHPELLVDEIQKISEDFPEIISCCGKPYFLAFVAGVLAEKYGISVLTANQAANTWDKK